MLPLIPINPPVVRAPVRPRLRARVPVAQPMAVPTVALNVEGILFIAYLNNRMLVIDIDIDRYMYCSSSILPLYIVIPTYCCF